LSTFSIQLIKRRLYSAMFYEQCILRSLTASSKCVGTKLDYITYTENVVQSDLLYHSWECSLIVALAIMCSCTDFYGC